MALRPDLGPHGPPVRAARLGRGRQYRLALAFASGAGGSFQVSCAAFHGSGHRIELYGEAGALFLANPPADYFRRFELRFAPPGPHPPQPTTPQHPPTHPSPDSPLLPLPPPR